MSTRSRSYVIRLSAQGKRELERDLMSLGAAGQKHLKRIQSASKQASSGLAKTEKSARGLGGALQAVGREVPAVQRLARFLGTTALVGALASFGRASLDVARTFEAAMKRVAGVTRATGGEMAALSEKAMELGATTAFTATEAAAAIEVLAKNGLGVSDVLGGALDATLAMASALGADLAPSADLVTDVMLQFNLAASDLPRIVDAVTGAALNSKFGFDDLRLAIGQAGGVAGKFGVEIDDFLTALSATASGFSSGQDAGTSFKNFLQRLVPQSKQATEAMERLGLEFFDADGAMKSMAEIAEELRTGIDGLSEAARNEALQKIFGTDAIRTALLLAETGAGGFRELAAAIGEVSAADQAEIRLQGLEGALRELASAWESLQLISAQNGGLDLAEQATRRLTDAIRYLSENFTEVEEVVERVAQALMVFLVARGLNVAIARSIAMQAAYIELAGSVTGVGTAASRAVGPLTRMGIAGRALAGVFGGPLSLAITALSLGTLLIDLDKTEDQIDAASRASEDAASALERFAEATRKAKLEQGELGGEISEATRKIQEQSRAVLQASLRELEVQKAELFSNVTGDGLFDTSELQRTIDAIGIALRGLERGGLGNGYLEDVLSVLKEFRAGRSDAEAVAAAYSRLLGVGQEAQDLINDFTRAAEEGTGVTHAADRIVAYAESVGLFGEEMRNLSQHKPYGPEWFRALDKLQQAMLEAEEASKIVRRESASGFQELISKISELDPQIGVLKDALSGIFEDIQKDPGETFVAKIAEDAEAAAKSLDKARAAHGEYARSRLAGGVPESSKKLLGQVAGASTGADAAAQILRHFEGFIATPKYDVNALRTGFGSDTVTLADGSIKNVVAGMRVSVEDANRDLIRRVGDLQESIVQKIGSDRYGQFTPAQQGVLTSLLYNYGAGEFRAGGDLGGVLSAAQTGTNADIAAEIRALRSDNGFVNAGRRDTEAQVFSGNIGVSDVVARSERQAAAAAEQRKRVLAEQEETIQRLIDAGNEQAAQLELETALVGATSSERLRLTYIHEKLLELKKAGIDVEKQTTESGRLLIDVIREQADELARLNEEKERDIAASEGQKDKINETKDAVQSAFDNFKRGGDGIKGFFDDLVDHITDKLFDLAFDPVWDWISAGLDTLIGAIGGGLPGGAGGGGLPGGAGGGALPGLAGGGAVQFRGRAAGMLQGPGHNRQDNLLFWGSKGEFMQPAAAVDFYGQDFMEAVRQRRFPRLEMGGALGSGMAAIPAPGAAGNARSVGRGDVHLHFHDASGDQRIREIAIEGTQAGMEIYDRGRHARMRDTMSDPRKRL